MEGILVLKEVSKIYPGDFMALDNINLEIKAGEFVSVVGQTGAGKSTLLKLIYAEETPTLGEVYFNGKSVREIRRKHLPYYRRNIGTVFQDFKLLPQKTVFENVAYALEVNGETTEEIGEKVPEILDVVGIGSKLEMYPRQLSGGEQQKVALARALINCPQIIVADEPTGNLDPISTWDIIQLLLKINTLGTTILLATHNNQIVDKINRRVITMDKGRVVNDIANGKYSIE
ncbi:MAG: cell division ATP-binding protein FtsE, partial [bacterium]|nr:cell division ATP-binding protein FtsE [bacterium]